MKSPGRYYLIPLVFAFVIFLAVALFLPNPRKLSAALEAKATPVPTVPPAETAPPVTASPSPQPTAAQAAMATASPAEETAVPPSPASETPPPEKGPVTIGGKTFLADGTGKLVFNSEGLHEWDGYTYYYFDDKTIAVSQAVSVAGSDYVFDDKGRWLSPLRMAVEASGAADMTDQLVLVVDRSLSFWEKGEDGAWRQRLETRCGYGKNGLVPAEERVMGSKTTPVGLFPLTLAFGTGENPGTEMPYRQITEDSYWSEAEDGSFNTWVESETPVPGEHLADYYQYKYAVNIGFNLEDIVYSRGSAIFLHVKSTNSWNTAGCVSLEEGDMLTLLLALKDGAYMIIVPDLETLAEY